MRYLQTRGALFAAVQPSQNFWGRQGRGEGRVTGNSFEKAVDVFGMVVLQVAALSELL